MFEIGNTLREARVRRNLTLQQAEEDIKVRVKYIQAMENEDWDLLPGVTYAKGFLRTYSTYLGLDADVIVEEFRSRGMVPSEERHEPFGGSSVIGKPRSHRGRNTIVVVAVICLLALGGIYVLGLMNDPADHEPTTQPDALGIGSPSPSPSESPTPHPTETTLPAWKRDLVKVRAVRGDCWMDVRRDDAEGVVLFTGTVRKGDLKKFKGKTIWLSLGAPSSVDLEAAGKRIKIKSDVGPWTVKIVRGRAVQGPDAEG